VNGELLRGGVNTVLRTGDLVRRPAGPWTATVQALLAHVAAAGFPGAPRPHGMDEQGRDVVEFVPGDVPAYPVPAYARSDASLRRVATLLRDLHDATVDFAAPVGATWYLPPREPPEVVCHGDIAPYNCVFRDGVPVAFIDFDTAHPGPRVWDVAYAAYRFVPLTDPDGPDGHGHLDEQARRLRLMCDSYRLDAPDRAALIATMLDRLDALVDHIHVRAAAGDAAFASHLAMGHVDLYLSDAAYIGAHEEVLTAAVA
jgi:aminoglycoside phosphotransferase (APT) family kinase protein